MGVKLYFLSPYSPELNRIETLWHLMKHKWMAVNTVSPTHYMPMFSTSLTTSDPLL